MDYLGGYTKIIFLGFQMNIEFENILDANDDLIELVRNWRNSKQVSQYMYTDHHISKEEHDKWVEKLRTKDTTKAWIIKYNGQPVGIAQLSNINYSEKTTEWGFYIADESLRGKGVGSASLLILIEIVFEEMNFNEMTTMVLENNSIAMKLYEKFGFKEKGELEEKLDRNGKQINVYIMMLLKEEWSNIKDTLRKSIK
jgi:UDP-4-amino-4,6-dideoxy-N-acetyl-beta-L-altrosamine N-acetyltransferase